MFCALHAPASPRDLVRLAEDFSPRIEIVCPGLVVFDAQGLGRLLGEPREIGAACRRLADARGLTVAIALAGTRTAASLLALGSPPGLVLAPAGGEAAAMAPLPLSVLSALAHAERPIDAARVKPGRPRRPGGRGSGRHYRLAPTPDARPADRRSPRAAPAVHPDLIDFLATLHRWGLSTLGELAALPPIDLFERTGTIGLAWQAVARGDDLRPLVPAAADAPFEAAMALDWPIETLEPLSFVLGRLMDPLCARLDRDGLGTTMVQLTLRLVTRELHVRRLALPAPMRDAKVLRTLALLDLESHPPPAGIDGATVTFEAIPARIVQHSLLTRAAPIPEQMAMLTARLAAVLGEDRVGAPVLLDAHRPGTFGLRPFDGETQPALAPAPGPEAPAADGCLPVTLRRFRRPLPVRVAVERGRPVHVGRIRPDLRGGQVVQSAGPWRTSGEWWCEGEEGEEGGRRKEEGGREAAVLADGVPWDVDEWDVALASGLVLRLAHDRATGAWAVAAVID